MEGERILQLLIDQNSKESSEKEGVKETTSLGKKNEMQYKERKMKVYHQQLKMH